MKKKIAGSLIAASLVVVVLFYFQDGCQAYSAFVKPPSHARLTTLLAKYVTEKGVDYRGMLADYSLLDSYLKRLAITYLGKANRAEKLAFYINAYNACTLRMILRHYGKIKSIREIKSKFGYKQWKRREWVLAGEKLSLDDIEHKKLRGELKEQRIHFAIVCASVGCPVLWNQAYSSGNIEKELDAAAGRFMRNSRYVRLEKPESGNLGGKAVLKISKIFKWFGSDFKPGVVDFIYRYANPEVKAAITEQGRNRVAVEYLSYDWLLNDSAKKPKGK